VDPHGAHTHPDVVGAAGVQAAAVALALGDGTTNAGAGLIEDVESVHASAVASRYEIVHPLTSGVGRIRVLRAGRRR
jgi:hypothetical protein